MPLEESARLARDLASHGYTADREAITLLANADDPPRALLDAVEVADDDALKLTAADVREVLDCRPGRDLPIAGPRTEPSSSESDAGHTGPSTTEGGPTPDSGTARAGTETAGASTEGARESSKACEAASESEDRGGIENSEDRSRVEDSEARGGAGDPGAHGGPHDTQGREGDPPVSSGAGTAKPIDSAEDVPVETKGSGEEGEHSSSREPSAQEPSGETFGSNAPTETSPTRTEAPTTQTETAATATEKTAPRADASTAATDESATDHGRSPRSVEIANDMTGHSTGTGEYEDFVATFRDRYERLSRRLTGRVNHRNAKALEASPGGTDAGMVGMVSDVRSTKSGHWLVELEDTTGVFPCLVLKDRDVAALVDELLFDEVVAVDGMLSDDGGVLFVDDLYFPDVPRTHRPSTADRHVRAALISDVHVGSQEFMAEAWQQFASWLHTDDAERIEYLLVAGDMVEGVGIYPGQDEELDIVDIFEQYEAFAEYLKEVPGGLEIVMIPGNHDAVRLAEPQPGFDDELRSIMSAHDARIASNPSVVDVEGVSVLMYHGVSLDEVIAELPEGKASYEDPHRAMYQLLKKRHLAPQFGGHTRLAPEDRDYLVIDDVPDVFHTGHVHKLGWGKYRNVLAVNSGCWQAQTDFQRSVNIDPDAGFAPVVDLDTLELTVHKFA